MRSITAAMAALALAATMPALAQSSKAPVRREERRVIISRNGDRPEMLSNDSMVVIEQMNADDLPNIDSLRAELHLQDKEAQELKIELRQINRDIQKQMRGMKQMKIVINGDTAGLGAEMEHVRKSIDAANGNLLQVDSNIRHMILPGVGEISMSLIPDSGMVKGTKRMVIVMNDSTLCHHAGTLGKGKHNCGMMTSTVIVRSTTDSTLENVMLNGLGENGDLRVEVLTSDSLGMPRNTDGTTPMIARERIMIRGNDTIRVIDGAGSRTVVRIGRDSAGNGARSRVVIVTTTKQIPAGSDTLEGPTLDARQSSEHADLPEAAGYQLEANRPNPFSSQTVISFTIPKAGQTKLTVFNAEGGEVKVLKDENLPAGSYSVTFDGSTLPSGTYLYRLVSGGYSETKTMSLTK